MEKFFCECVNSMRMNIERRCAYETIKFNDAVCTHDGESLS
jgi:hypothetical protein